MNRDPLIQDVARVRGLVSEHLPAYSVASVRVLGEGLDNLAFLVNEELIVRCAKEPDPHALRYEARVLATIAEVSPLPVPKPAFTSPEEGCLAYFKLRGVPLLRQRLSNVDAIVVGLRRFLSVLHATPVPFAEPRAVPMAEWLGEAAEFHTAVARHVPAAHSRAIEAFLDSGPPPQGHPMVFCHNDLGIEHILAENRDVTGVIDWGDAGLTDPARDYGTLYRDLGPAAEPPPDLRERAIFYARCAVFEDLDYGLSTGGQAYIDKCLTSLRWLFPA